MASASKQEKLSAQIRDLEATLVTARNDTDRARKENDSLASQIKKLKVLELELVYPAAFLLLHSSSKPFAFRFYSFIIELLVPSEF